VKPPNKKPGGSCAPTGRDKPDRTCKLSLSKPSSTSIRSKFGGPKREDLLAWLAATYPTWLSRRRPEHRAMLLRMLARITTERFWA
jgi:hypothetical protein